MPDLALLDCQEPESVKLQRVRYFQRQLLTADDMVTDQDYFRQKLRRHNRFLHGWGVVCGLGVVPDPEPLAPWRVFVEPGYALGPQGDEIFVGAGVSIDLAECGPGATTDPCDPAVLHPGTSDQGSEVFLAIRYAECVANPVRALPAGCGCEEEICEYSRICDSFQVECLEELPPSHAPQPDPATLCDILAGNQVVPCLPCPTEPWIVLARIALPASPLNEITEAMIENAARRQIFSTAVLQEQLIACCCDREEITGADLSITQTAAVEQLGAGEISLFLSARVVNNGPDTSVGLTFNDTISIPGGSIFAGDFSTPISPDGEWTDNDIPAPPPPSSLTVAAEIPELGPGDVAEIDFSLEVRLGNATSATSTFSVSSTTADPDLSNNSGQIVVPLVQTQLPDLLPVPNPNQPGGGPFAFCDRSDAGLVIRIRNQGAGDAPASITRVVFSPGGPVDIPTPAIPAGQTVTLDPIDVPGECFDPDCSFTITANANNDFNEANTTNNAARGACLG